VKPIKGNPPKRIGRFDSISGKKKTARKPDKPYFNRKGFRKPRPDRKSRPSRRPNPLGKSNTRGGNGCKEKDVEGRKKTRENVQRESKGRGWKSQWGEKKVVKRRRKRNGTRLLAEGWTNQTKTTWVNPRGFPQGKKNVRKKTAGGSGKKNCFWGTMGQRKPQTGVKGRFEFLL